MTRMSMNRPNGSALVNAAFISEANAPRVDDLRSDYAALGGRLARDGVEIDRITEAVAGWAVALPSWGVGTGGTRALLVDKSGRVRHGCTAPHEEMTMERPLWAEQLE